MRNERLLFLRQTNHHLVGTAFHDPADAVRTLCAVQAQDYGAAAWALAQRCTADVTRAAVDEAFSRGVFLRTHVLRPTWHFVAPDDLAWMLELSSKQVRAAAAPYCRRLGLDRAFLKRTNRIIARALDREGAMTREELGALLTQEGIDVGGPMRLAYIVGDAETEGLVCSGPLKGKRHTYALLSKRAPAPRKLSRAEAAVELALRYFGSHGPATLRDFCWWSGMGVREAKAAVADAGRELVADASGDNELFSGRGGGAGGRRAGSGNAERAVRGARSANTAGDGGSAATVRLLANYDEFVIAYADRSAFFDPALVRKVDARGNLLFNNVLVVNGVACGAWKPKLSSRGVTLTVTPFRRFTKDESRALAGEAERYAHFHGTAGVTLDVQRVPGN